MLWVSGLGLLIGGGTLFAAWRAAHWAKEAATHTESGATESKRAADIATDTAERQLRAYLGCENTFIQLYKPTPMATGRIVTVRMIEGEIRFEIRNAGQTPAYDVCMICRLEYSGPDHNSHKMIFRDKPDGTKGKSIIGPNGRMLHHSRFDIPENFHDPIKNGELVPVLAVMMSYRDAFGKRHRTIGHYWYDKDSAHGDIGAAMLTCERGNAAN